jgi:protein-disulfide isomerase
MSRFSPLALIAVAGVLLLAACSRGSATSTDDMTMGDPKAAVKMVEYASASCSHCATFNNTVFPAFKAKYIDTGKVGYTFKEFLTPPVEVAAAGFLTARCAGKDKYFSVVDAIFRAQNEVTDALTDVAFALENLSDADWARAGAPTKGNIARYLTSDVTKLAFVTSPRRDAPGERKHQSERNNTHTSSP